MNDKTDYVFIFLLLLMGLGDVIWLKKYWKWLYRSQIVKIGLYYLFMIFLGYQMGNAHETISANKTTSGLLTSYVTYIVDLCLFQAIILYYTFFSWGPRNGKLLFPKKRIKPMSVPFFVIILIMSLIGPLSGLIMLIVFILKSKIPLQ